MAAAADRAAANHAADARAAAWAMEWSAWYGRYLARATEQSERTAKLYHQVADATARGDLASTAIQDMLGTFYAARGSAYAERLSELTSRFFSRLVETAAIYSREMAEGVMQGVPEPPPLLQLEPSDPNVWFRQLTDYGNSLSSHISSSYKAFLDRVAAGQVDSEKLKSSASEYFARKFPEYLRQLGRLYFDLLTDLNELRAGGEQDFLSGVLATAGRSRPADALTVDLTGPAQGFAKAKLAIANTQNQLTVVRYRVTDIRRADGIGPAFPPRISIIPDELELRASEEGSFVLSVELSEDDYVPDTLYVGALHISGHDEQQLEVPLRIMMTSKALWAHGSVST